MQAPGRDPARDAAPAFGAPPGASAPVGDTPQSAPPASGEQTKQSSDDDAMKRLLESMQGDKEKKP